MKEEELLSMIDGAKVLVELFKPVSKAQKKWREDWLKSYNDLIEVLTAYENPTKSK